jgi:hypothetical protein
VCVCVCVRALFWQCTLEMCVFFIFQCTLKVHVFFIRTLLICFHMYFLRAIDGGCEHAIFLISIPNLHTITVYTNVHILCLFSVRLCVCPSLSDLIFFMFKFNVYFLLRTDLKIRLS